MQITLKKASELQRMAIEAAGKIEVKGTVMVPFYSKGEPEEFVPVAYAHGTENFAIAVADTLELLAVGYEIRRLLGVANASQEHGSSINDLLAERAMIEASEKRLQALLQVAESAISEPDCDEVVARIHQQRKTIEKGGAEIRYGIDRNIEMRVVDEYQRRDLRNRLANLRFRKSELTDILAGRNLNTKITLTEDIVVTLRGHKIISY
ncbi:unnamed protein product [Sphagnum tenellum]